MKQVVQNYRTGVLKVDEVPAPAARTGGVLVATRASLISAGTEKATVEIARKSLLEKAADRPDLVRKLVAMAGRDGLAETLRMAFRRLDTPAALGYSCAGTVIGVGDRVAGIAVGDRVACAGQDYASHAQVVFVPQNLCVKMPDEVSFEEAAFVALGAIALQGVRQVGPALAEQVAVIGLGLLGQLTIQLLKAAGCLVIASDVDPSRFPLARTLGADVVAVPREIAPEVAHFTGGRGVDAVLITASTRDNGPVEIAGEIARQKGRVVVVGAVGMTIPREPYYRKELELRLSTSYGPGRYDTGYEEKGRDYPYGYVRWTEKRNMEAFLTLVGQRRVDTARLVTHRFDIGEAERAYALMLDGREPHLGIVITYPGDAPVGDSRVVPIGAAPAGGRRAGAIALGIIGAGSHVKDRLLPRLTAMRESVGIRAICAAAGHHAKALGERVGAVYGTGDYRALLADPEIDAVLIGTRHDLHGPMVLAALEAGKHVFVEKPLCLTEDELAAIASAYDVASAAGLQLMVGFNRRFSPHAARARDCFEGRREPLVMAFRVNVGAMPADHWTQDPEVGGGRILGEACHFVDFMQAVCGARPVSVHARCIGRHGSGITDDQSVLSLAFADGSVGSIVYAAGGERGLAKERFEAFGDGKAFVMDDFLLSESYAHGKRLRFRSRAQDKGFDGELSRFVDAVRGGAGPAMPFDEIEAVTRACLLAVRSMRTGEPYDL